jgi:hypothetical protein
MNWTHKCRVYRTSLQQRHDLSLLRKSADVTSQDEWCCLYPSKSELLELPNDGELSMVGRPADIWLPTAIDVQEGSYVKVYKSVVANGNREAVKTTLASVTAIGDTSLKVKSVRGFAAGDNVLVDSSQWVRVQAVSGLNLTLYTNHTVKSVFSIGDTAEVVEFFRIIQIHGVLGPAIQCLATRVPMASVQ